MKASATAGEAAFRRLVSVRDSALRRCLLAELLATLPATDGEDLLAIVVAASLARREAGHALMIVVAQLFALGPIDYEVARDIYAIAKERGHDLVAGLFMGVVPHQEVEPWRVPLGHLTLGERRALARRPTAVALDKLLRDPDPVVIRNLLNAPRVTEREVIKMAARRTAPATVLLAIVTSERFGTREAVRVALARNPSTPIAAALALLPSLEGRVIGAIANDEVVHAALRQAAQSLFREQSARKPVA